ncbi:aurora kinase A and ninein-interacting protein [Melanotaenia boesemani]|uniref:aurora kinase A and ninein-interacting protein n=1 Tax=Melanotaenia boesemani TaxID=1250792 RepID=UPI001C042BDA|nr:aurora kinase A and ninein-interacting protein [Melanotaenia boesemani]XP_041868551.1 aurora kinase A and ninein-interacting protein [Melanotaenia boesemani]
MTMKTPKATPQNAAPEECGVWLDTVQLKEKNKRKRPARPISKQLNPLAEGGGYSFAVALNFTQTKMEMPKTKQSSISTFFTSHRRVLNKMSSSEVPSLHPLEPLLSSTSSAITTMVSVRKRRRDICLKKSDLYDTESGVGNWQSEKNVTEMDATLWQKKAEHYSESEEDLSEECKPPQSKRRLTENSLLPNNKQEWSQDLLFTCSQNSETEFYLPDQKSSTSKNCSSYEPGFLDSLQSEETFGNLIDVTRRTSTQKLIKNPSSSQLDDDKENSRSLSFSSMSKRSSSSNLESLSDHKWTEPKGTSPQKHASQLWNKTEKDECFETMWTKRISSPFKKPLKQIREVDGDSLATLFTQDSEGFRVIAHRGLQTRSPLKDQSNLSTEIVRTNVYTCVTEDEDEMLFTQDSQGNMVIKH